MIKEGVNVEVSAKWSMQTASGCIASTSIQTLYVQYMASDGYNVANARMIFRHKGNVYEPQSDKSSQRSS